MDANAAVLIIGFSTAVDQLALARAHKSRRYAALHLIDSSNGNEHTLAFPASEKMIAMKGIVFTELLDFIAVTHGHDMVDDVIDDCRLPSGGAYTSVGTYDHAEMQALIAALARRTGDQAPDILKRFGRQLCCRFVESFPGFFRRKASLFDFLESVDGYIHVEVHKLYPDAEFPSFQTHARDDSSLQLDYRSCRPLAALAEGLILGASDYFHEPVGVIQTQIEDPNGSFVRFTIRRV